MAPLWATLLRPIALAACLCFLEAAQSVPDAAQKMIRANELVQAGKPEAAIPIYKELEVAFPADPSIGANLAIAQFKAGLYRDAILQCRRLLRLRPDLFPALLFLGASQLKLGEVSSAIEPLRHAVAINPNDPNARLMLADALSAKQPREAAEQYEKAALALPDNPRAWFGMYRSCEAGAADLLSKLEQTNPASAEFQALSGDFKRDRLEFARAFQDYRQALALAPSFRGLHAKVAEVYQETGQREWAVAERAREATAACNQLLTECDFVNGRIEQAAAAISSDPGSLYWQGLALRVLAGRAYAHLQQDLPPSKESYEAAAESHERSGRYRAAAAAWKQALALAPDDVEIQRRLALALCHANDCISALPLLKELLAKTPAAIELNYLLGLALNATSEPAEALPYLEKAVRLEDKFLPAHAALGEALLESGEPERAIPHLEAAISEDESGVRHYQLARALQAAGRQTRAVGVLREYRAILDRRMAAEKDEPRITAP